MATINQEGLEITHWSSLRGLKEGDALPMPEWARSLIDEGVYKISDAQYCLAQAIDENGQDKLTLISFYWASSEGAFRRAYFREVESDDMAVSPPPMELMPEGSGTTYIQIKRALMAIGTVMEHASYRVMSDGAFVHKSLENSSAVYHFRSPEFLDDEIPYAILWKPRGG